jgi:hypothetical protein
MINLGAAGTIGGIAGTSSAITYTIFGMTLLSGAETYSVLAQGQMTTSAATLYTVPVSTTAFIKQIVLVNTTVSAVTGNIIYANGTTAPFQITGSFTIPANGTAVMDDGGLHVFDTNGNLFTTAALSFSASLPGVTTPAVFSAVGSSLQPARSDHQHQSPGGIASLTSTSSGINSAETVVLNVQVPANFFQSGTTIRINGYGSCTSSVANASNFRCRIGTAGTTSDTQIVTVSPTAATSGTSVPFMFELLVTSRGTGSSTTFEGSGCVVNLGITGVSSTTNTVATNSSGTVNTTVANYIDFTYVAAASTTTCTFYNVIIEIVKM